MKRNRMKKWFGMATFLFLLSFVCAACQQQSVMSDFTLQTDAKGSGKAEANLLEGDSTLEVHYMDVGQGDATLIICDGEAMLIDGGNNDKGTAVQSYLNSQNVTALKYVVGTHPDADHIGGLDVVITKFDCDTVLLSSEEKDTATYRDVLDAIDYKGCKKVSPKVGEEYSLGSAEFTIVGPSEENSDSNNNSIALVIEHGENRFYFQGDASKEEEIDILKSGRELDADVYMVGHHGSKTSTSDELLSAVNPNYAVISVGEGNSYGHPNAEVLNKLRKKGVSVFRTDEQGTIVAVSNGTQIKWNCSTSESWQAGEPGASSDVAKTEGITSDDTTSADSTSWADMVHITKSGKKYHNAGCEYLKNSDIEISLQEATKQGYTACSKCNPPQ